MSIRTKTFTATAILLTLAAGAAADPAPATRPANLAITLDSKVVLGKLPVANLRVAQPDMHNLAIAGGVTPPTA